MDPITLLNKGDRKLRIADHAVIVVALDEDGQPMTFRTRGDGTLDTGQQTPVRVSGSFVRPADVTAYTTGDLVANDVDAVDVVPVSLAIARVNDGKGSIQRVVLSKTSTGVTNATFRVHLYRTAPTVTNGDNGAWLSTQSGYLGFVDVTIDKAFSDGASGAGVPAAEINFEPTAGAKTIFALVEARGAYTPASAETFTVTVEALQS